MKQERGPAAVVQANNIAGVVLAGGRSSRMGQDKAFLEFDGVLLLDRMMGILKETGLRDIYVSGNFEGYNCIADTHPRSGPAHAICDVMNAMRAYRGVLIVPVDMPFLTSEILQLLLEHSEGGFFENRPLPVFLPPSRKPYPASSVRQVLEMLGIQAIKLPTEFEFHMTNINTPQELSKALSA